MEDHIRFDPDRMELHLLDQRLLPGRKEYFVCRSCEDVISAIRTMVVRGAPAIGVAAAYGCVLAACDMAGHTQNWRGKLEEKLGALENSRPTAVNLSWAIARMREHLNSSRIDGATLPSRWLELAEGIKQEDIQICRKLGMAGQELIRDGDTVLTHCNAGALATAGYGTALGVIRAAVESGKKVRVIADETRPLLQGSRLTAFELAESGIPVTVACDNACATLMRKGFIQLVITGADRIAANGDTANKIGTFGVAIMARYFNIPFYIAAPLSTIDTAISSGNEIPVEERSREEVAIVGDKKIMPDDVPVFNFAFDATPADLIDGIITEAGILRPPYEQSIARAFAMDGGHSK